MSPSQYRQHAQHVFATARQLGGQGTYRADPTKKQMLVWESRHLHIAAISARDSFNHLRTVLEGLAI